ncbi:hypothetical protein HRF59_20615 [Bacillus velezensis]|uniref:hypothetical protein n=1 Tax=Bacillus amyloliquefaciens group TaxID=1938374 RepID=UPI00140478BC|nr:MULTISPECIES: hypothetical protein [Bacillus amyloliquefaciens group]NHN20913.1 hypothetical protein [Bacillus amyloliquefaciens]NRG16044.1 hypothetical protein [Bacillus velezensis]
MDKIKIIDSIMGSGKTSYMIQKMNEAPKEDKFIFITPYLDEVKRIKEACPDKKFIEPKIHSVNGETFYKLDSLHKHLSDNKNIATTHALFKMANETTKELIYSGNYTLILDEAIEVVKQLNISADDLDMLFKNNWIINKDDRIIWNMEQEKNMQREYDGEFKHLKQLALNNNLILHNDSVILWNFPADIFKLFKEVFNLTYLFDGQLQKYYYDLNNIPYEKYMIKKDKGKYKCVPYDSAADNHIKDKIKIKVNVYDGDLNKIGEEKYSLSKGWYRNKRVLHKRLQNNILNYFQNICKSKSNFNMWTTFIDYKPRLSGKGYTKGFIPCNIRSTNEHSHKNTLVYAINRYCNPLLVEYFSSKGVKVDETYFALSEMIQWIWRSSIRNNDSISIYIPSRRMRSIFIDWLNNDL